MRLALFCLLIAGCSFCHAPARPDNLPPGVEATAFIDQHEECWTVELKPGADLVLNALVAILKIVVGSGGEGGHP